MEANSNDKSPFHLIRFAGLFDCSKFGAHAVARLHYKGAELTDIQQNTKYEDCLDNVGPVLNALNYAPPTDEDNFRPEWLPITVAEGLYNNEKCDNDTEIPYLFEADNAGNWLISCF